MRGNKANLSLAACLSLAAGCASGDKNPSDALSYDPNLRPGEMFFNPDAEWAKGWAKARAPAKPDEQADEISEAVIEGTYKKPSERVPWAVLRLASGKVEVLAAGVKPSATLAAERFPAAPPQPARALQTVAVAAPFSMAEKSAAAGLADSESDGYNWQLHQVAKTPFRVRGELLNGYFFVRQRGESWQHLSKVVYGSDQRAASLQDWNDDKPLKVGAVLYFNSPHRPQDDRRMLFIADDFNQTYVVTRSRRGEPLSLLAERLYGQWRTWREIAYFNGLRNPHALENNTLLRVAPARLGHEASALPAPELRSPAGTRDPATHNR